MLGHLGQGARAPQPQAESNRIFWARAVWERLPPAWSAPSAPGVEVMSSVIDLAGPDDPPARKRRRSDSDDDVIDLCGAESAAPRGAEPGAPFVFSIDLTGDDDPDAASVADVKPKPEGIAAFAHRGSRGSSSRWLRSATSASRAAWAIAFSASAAVTTSESSLSIAAFCSVCVPSCLTAIGHPWSIHLMWNM